MQFACLFHTPTYFLLIDDRKLNTAFISLADDPTILAPMLCLFCCVLFHDMVSLYRPGWDQTPKWPGVSLSFPFNGIFIVVPGRSACPSGTKTTRPTEFKVTGTGSKYFPSGSLGLMMNQTVPFSTP